MLNKIQPDKSGFVWLHRLIDALLPLPVLYLIINSLTIPWHDRYVVMGVLGGFIFVFSAQQVGTYRNWRGRSLFESIKLIINAWLITWALLIIFAFLYRDSENFSRVGVTSWAAITPLLLITYRILIRIIIGKIRSLGKNTKTIAIIGAGTMGQQIANIFQENPWLGYQVSAYYDDNTDLHGDKINNIPVIGGTEKLAEAVNLNQYSEIYICLPLRAEQKIKDILEDLTDTITIVKFVPDLFSFDLMHSTASYLKGIPVFSVYDTPLNSIANKIIKRIEDIVISSLILVIASPILLMISIGVKFSSPGPIFYRQNRIGWNGETFEMLKFRSMPTDTEKGNIEWGGATSKTNTKFGKFIRATSLDELPQFLNVLKGDMSIIGPRPERNIFVEQFRKEIPRYMQKHMVKAGITGWAQVNGWRGDTCLNTRIEFDLDYINRWSLWLDIKIIVLTIFKGFINKNAV
jgi:putative colanic acid biosynthesis UDP-glucose lipid carrier transferase